jgi:hypothetical protein
MKKFVLFGWLLVPAVAAAYHYGPGQDRMKLDDVAQTLATADQYASNDECNTAVHSYDEALAKFPAGADQLGETRRVRLERAKAQMMAGLLPEANADLKTLVEELQSDKSADAKVLADARNTLASSQYYLTWLMKLEGLGRDDWEPEIESARQLYRLLAEQAEASGDTAAAKMHVEDVESAIRLARMEPGELQGKAIPKQCQGCKSGQCKKPGKKPGKNNNEKDMRKQGSGPPPDNSGS